MADNFVIVIPAKNEARTIYSIVKSARKICPSIIVVDDHSTDRTGFEAARGGATVQRHDFNQGYSAAVLTGIALGIKKAAQHIVTIDGDGAHDPTDIPSLLSKHIGINAALTIGDRLSSTGLAAHSTKLRVNHLAWPILSRATGLDLPKGDYASGLRIYSREFASHMLLSAVNLRPFGLCYYSIFDAILNGRIVSFVPCTVRYDASRLLYTTRGEFVDFLTTAIDVASNKEFIERCTALRESAINKCPLRFSVEGEVVYAIPLTEADGYIFQSQCEFYEEFVHSDFATTFVL